MDFIAGLTPEIIASGLVGLLMLGVVVKNVISGWYEANKRMRESERASNPLSSAISVSWDKDQIERALQLLEAISESLELQSRHMEAVAKAQGILSDSFQQTTQSRLNDILTRLDLAEHKTVPPRRR